MGSSASRSCDTVTGQSADADRQQRGRCDENHFGAERVEQQHVGPRHPAVQDVADDHHALALDAAQPLPDGQRIEQRLGRMFVGTVACVDHGRAAVLGSRPLGELLGRARRGVTDDQRVGAGGREASRRCRAAIHLWTQRIPTR